jgi:thiol-disulfide isomerase/thioredoxin
MATVDDYGPTAVETEVALDRATAEGLVLVEFYTEGCGICAAQEPTLSAVARGTDASVVVCNPRDDLVLVSRFDVRRVPTFLLFRDGEVVARRDDGFVPADELVALVEAHDE